MSRAVPMQCRSLWDLLAHGLGSCGCSCTLASTGHKFAGVSGCQVQHSCTIVAAREVPVLRAARVCGAHPRDDDHAEPPFCECEWGGLHRLPAAVGQGVSSPWPVTLQPLCSPAGADGALTVARVQLSLGGPLSGHHDRVWPEPAPVCQAPRQCQASRALATGACVLQLLRHTTPFTGAALTSLSSFLF